VSARGYMMRSARGDWRTPPEVVAVVREALGGGIDLDPCASSEPGDPPLADANMPKVLDGLSCPWRGRVYVNPPFGELAAWSAKCALEHRERGAEVVLLLPARTDTAYWHDHLASASLVAFWRGRLRFVGAPASCPFPVAFAYWGARPALFHAAFAPHAMVVAPSRGGLRARGPEHISAPLGRALAGVLERAKTEGEG
jgi:hypothetical protein